MKLPKVLKSVLIFLTLLGAGIVFIPTFQGAGNIDVQVQMDSLLVYRKNVGGVTGGVGYPYKTNFSIQNEY